MEVPKLEVTKPDLDVEAKRKDRPCKSSDELSVSNKNHHHNNTTNAEVLCHYPLLMRGNLKRTKFKITRR